MSTYKTHNSTNLLLLITISPPSKTGSSSPPAASPSPFLQKSFFPPRALLSILPPTAPLCQTHYSLYCPGNVTFCCITLNVVNVLLSISFSFFQVSSQAAPLQLFPQGSHYLPQPFFFFFLRPSTSSSILKINLSLPHTNPLANSL